MFAELLDGIIVLIGYNGRQKAFASNRLNQSGYAGVRTSLIVAVNFIVSGKCVLNLVDHFAGSLRWNTELNQSPDTVANKASGFLEGTDG